MTNHLLSVVVFAPLVGAVLCWVVGRRVRSEPLVGAMSLARRAAVRPTDLVVPGAQVLTAQRLNPALVGDAAAPSDAARGEGER